MLYDREGNKNFWEIVDDPEDCYAEADRDIHPEDKVVVVDAQQGNVNLEEDLRISEVSCRGEFI